ncbi:sensor histidine kinase [Pseudoalteromonas sp. S2755]|uniref:sensor histidine kinase n=1 Tax=Pseudoalteromonas sp. S2755 TaxID=2066523 RepID=UPI00110B713A|nr:sensor histidine kinase [Pseudoalteromonas sp. S2755]TMN46045.1 histidine kinase [Pseudoalteromonas sp. S2755]
MNNKPRVSAFMNLSNKLSFIWFAVIVSVGLVASNALIGFNNVKELNQVQESIRNTSEVMMSLDQLHIAMLNAEAGQRAFLISNKESDLAPFEKSLQSLDESIAKVAQNHSESDVQQQKINRYIDGVKRRFKTLQSTIIVARNTDTGNEALLLDRAADSGGDLREEFTRIMAAEVDIRAIQLNQLKRVRKEAQTNIVVFTLLSAAMIFAILLLLVANLRSTKQAKRELEQANDHLEEKVQARTEALEHYAEELNRSNRELEDFAFVASHDLQEPLRKIRAFGDRIEKNYGEYLDDKGRDYLARMTGAAQRMSTLITDLLELSRVTTRAKPFEEQDLNQVLQFVLEDLEIAVKDSNASVNAAVLPTIKCDASQIHQLFLNLLSNAIKFRVDGRDPVITISVENSQLVGQDAYTFVVEDNGVGFDVEYADKIFSPFQRLHDRKKYAGTGIGLTVCRRIVERHGGAISATSEDGKGAKFTITLLVEPTPIIQELKNEL